MYNPHANVDIEDEAKVMSGGRLVKARLLDQPAPNVDWYWFPLGNCWACKFFRQNNPACLNPKISEQDFFYKWMVTNTCPEFSSGADTSRTDFLDVMRAAGLARGALSQRVHIIVNEPWSPALAARAHREEGIFLSMAHVADYVSRGGKNDPAHYDYTDLSDDLERPKLPPPPPVAMSADAAGHEHRGKGAGGGQFTSGGGGGGGGATADAGAPAKPAGSLPAGSGEPGAREKAREDMKRKDNWTMFKGSNVPNPSLPDETRPEFSDTEAGALQNYTYQGDGPLHAKLRGLDYSWSTKTEEFIEEEQKELDSAFAKTPVMKKPVRVVRGMNTSQEVAQKFMDRFQQGLDSNQPVKIDDSYASTTRPGFLSELMERMGLKDNVKKAFRGNMKLTIDACHGIDMMPYSKFSGESELLLPRDAEFDVVSMKTKGGTVHIHLKQRPPKKGGNVESGKPLAISDADVAPMTVAMSDAHWGLLAGYYKKHPKRLNRWLNKGASISLVNGKKQSNKTPPQPDSIEEKTD